jgi:hypothetical protein
MSGLMDYGTWRALAAAELKRRYDIDADRVPERVWKQLYVSNASVQEAADRAEIHYVNARPSADRARRRWGLG